MPPTSQVGTCRSSRRDTHTHIYIYIYMPPRAGGASSSRVATYILWMLAFMSDQPCNEIPPPFVAGNTAYNVNRLLFRHLRLDLTKKQRDSSVAQICTVRSIQKLIPIQRFLQSILVHLMFNCVSQLLVFLFPYNY